MTPPETGGAPAAFAAKFRPARRSEGDLRATLMVGFGALAIVPMIVAVVAIVHIAEDGIVGSTSELARVSREAMGETSSAVSTLSRERIDRTGRTLSDIGSKAVRQTASALMGETETRFKGATEQLQGQAASANEALTRQLVDQSDAATRQLAGSLIGVSRESNQALTSETAHLAETAITSLADQLVDQTARNTSAISTHIVSQNKEAAQRLGERIVQDVEREPVVNFKTLASIFARGIASDKVAPLTDGYLAVVDMRGLVVASTRYRRGQSIASLPIVRQALSGQASEDSLIRFQDGNVQYLGVFARREDGGAVVFAYLADRARVDTERMKADLRRTLTHMGEASSGYVVKQLESQRATMRQTASALSVRAIGQLKTTSQSLSEATTRRMQAQADQVSAQARQAMAAQATAAASTTAAAMKQESRRIAEQTLEAMRPIGPRSAAAAEAAMRAEAKAAIEETARVLPAAAESASRQAAARMAPEAARLSGAAKHKMWSVALGLVGVEILLAILAALVMSGRIAAPILTSQQRAREARERLEREMEIASKIQTSLLPEVPTIEGFDVSVGMTPAEEVGGDFVELLPGEEAGSFWVGIGDVTGHGLTPGLIMMMAQSSFGALTREPDASPKAVYNGMNRVLYRNIKDRLRTSDHMTLSVLRHEADGSFVHSGAHLDLLIYRAALGTVERMPTDGPWVGLLPECGMFTTEQRFRLEPGDVLLLYTDGLIEVTNPAKEQWDMDRLVDALQRYAQYDAAEIQARLLNDALAWAEHVLDDISMVVLKRQPVSLTAVVPAADQQPALR